MLKSVISFALIILSIQASAQKPLFLFTFENLPEQSIKMQKSGLLILTEYNDLHPPKVKFAESASAKNCLLDNTSFNCALGASMKLENSDHGKKIFHLHYQLGSQKLENTIQLLPDDFPAYDFTGASKLTKNLMFALVEDAAVKNGHLLILKPSGGIFFYRHLDQQVHDFKPHTLDTQEVVYSYSPIEQFTELNSSGHRHILDQNFKEIKILNQSMDLHEFQMTSLDNYMGSFYERFTNPIGKCIVNQLVREYQNNKLIFQIGILDLIAKGVIQSRPLMIYFDKEICLQFFHLNSAEKISKNQLLISLGSQTVLMYDKNTEKIEWSIGGFSDQFGIDSSPMSTTLIHTPVWDARSHVLTLFDNGIESSSSRILQYEFDSKNKKIKKFDILFENGTFADYMGSVAVDQPRGESVLSIGWGHKRPGEINFEEVSNKKSHLKIKFKNNNLYSYKVYRH